MGFTIGGIRDLRSGSRRRGRASDTVTTVAEYTGLWGWDVVPGARAARGGRVSCSCGAAGCPAPGAHPLSFAPPVPAGATLDEAAAAWAEVPGAAVLLPVGRSFDVLEVSEAAGRHALARLERMGLPLGPVALTPHGRALFFVAPGAAAQLPQLLYRMGWDDTRLDLRGLGPGDHITAPPSDFAGLGPMRWLRPPALDTAARPPEARLLLGTLAYVSHRAGGAP
ncbi:bifunctional DNA primase/polymerase [Streptomyces morookaense]|uniref:Bifunctional DNA primase/polymerase n=1 Tax=Streptomyces morookaense TaxID=1970 RepID=A0A7Y7E9S7_STRMO|nr:bifunctional DNA primase/polymerase [Streptomyces morookaense]NVK80759.1 bifunctional DNA primase/polymerase [Streptomyces morookaense]GHF12116.1 DNA primase [Streptomyces morookaense]